VNRFSPRPRNSTADAVASFTAPVESGNVVELKDRSFGMTRVEVRSANGDSHLGHLFDDGPRKRAPSLLHQFPALRFIPYDELDASGYGDYKHLFDTAPKEEASQ